MDGGVPWRTRRLGGTVLLVLLLFGFFVSKFVVIVPTGNYVHGAQFETEKETAAAAARVFKSVDGVKYHEQLDTK